MRWYKDWILDPEEPPCFGHWFCSNCKAESHVEATPLMDEAAQRHGFSSFKDFIEQKFMK
jgi:hypothetical protein